MYREEHELLCSLSDRDVLNPYLAGTSLAELYHENTKLNRVNVGDHERRIQRVLKNADMVAMMRQPYKVYSLVEDRVVLPPIEPRNELERAIATRRTARHFSGEPVEVEELSALLRWGYGRTGRPPDPEYFRAVPSAGALYPLELYVAAIRVEGLVPGLYHYGVERHQLELLRAEDPLPAVRGCVFHKDIDLDHAALVIFITAIPRRSLIKYGDRGYRLILLEAGAVMQNVSLVACQQGLALVVSGGFFDDEVHRWLGVDGVNETVLLPVIVGRKAS